MKSILSSITFTIVLSCLHISALGQVKVNDVINHHFAEYFNGNIQSYKIYEYSSKNGSDSNVKENRLLAKTVYSYDKKNYLINQSRYLPDDTAPSTIWEYRYDNRLLKEIWIKGFDKKGNVTYNFLQVKFEQNNDTITKYFYNQQKADSVLLMSVQNSIYSENGKRVKTLTDVSNTQLFYNQNNFLEKMVVNMTHATNKSSDSFTPYSNEYHYKYDGFGNTIEEKCILPNNDPTKIIFKFKYQYDEKNNWIKKTSFYNYGFNKGYSLIETRMIKYR